uniref:C2 domain-containing protein n=1 Tax=Spermophilus dauricus TaxID=99837 RepID=A0A8C9QSG2_SPEDA
MLDKWDSQESLKVLGPSLDSVLPLGQDPVLLLSSRFTICHKTEVVKNTLNPVWQPFSIPVRALCNGDYDRTVKIDVYDWDRDGSHDFIGEFTTSYRELSKAQNQFTVYEVLNPRKKCKKKKYVNSGTVTLLSFSVDSEFTFVDYIKGGPAVGNPLQPTSLHYMSPYQLSAYAMGADKSRKEKLSAFNPGLI